MDKTTQPTEAEALELMHLFQNDMMAISESYAKEIDTLREDQRQLLDALKFFVEGNWQTVHMGLRMNRQTITIGDDDLYRFRLLITQLDKPRNSPTTPLTTALFLPRSR